MIIRNHTIYNCCAIITCLLSQPVCAESNTAASQNDASVTYRSAGNRPATPASPFSDALTEGPHGGIWQQDNLLGDAGGVRSFLGSYGLAINLSETSEVLGNVSGGIKRSAAYDGLTTLDVTLDTQRAFGWRGGVFNASALQVHGDNLSANNLHNLQTASGIEADRGVRLWELWYQQAFYNNKADIKIGQQSLDQEFMVSQNAGLFLNTMFGWPMIPSVDMIGGGPAYPLSSPGVRLRLQPNGPFTLLAGVFDDAPGGPCDQGDSQLCDKRGTNLRVNDDPLFIAELQFSRPAMGDLEYDGNSPPLPGTYKLGFWYDAGNFADQSRDTVGMSLADPASSGNPAMHRGNYSVYFVADQLLWRENTQSEHGVGFFTRIMAAPQDRNLVNFSLNIGLTLREPFEHREDDIVGLGVGYANVSNSASSLDNASNAFNGTSAPVRSNETFIEATYQYALAPWWSLQPDFQYVFHPGGGIANPDHPDQAIGDEAIIGLRTNIIF